MIIYQTNFGPIKRIIIWCSDSLEVPQTVLRMNPDIVYLFGIPLTSKLKSSDYRESLTYVYDFPKGETSNGLFNRLGKDTRRDVRICQKDKRISIKIFAGDSIPKALLKAACKTSNEMFKSKGLRTKMRVKPFIDQKKANTLFFSVSYFMDIPCVFHAYSIDGNNAICCLIATSFRQKNIDKKLSAMIHRYHCFFDMGHFQDEGYSHFDWGGIASATNPNGIDKFKMRFPGYPCLKAETVICCTNKGRFFQKIKRSFSRLH